MVVRSKFNSKLTQLEFEWFIFNSDGHTTTRGPKLAHRPTKNCLYLSGLQIPIMALTLYTRTGNQKTYMEVRNRTVGLRQQVQQSHHAEIPIQNSQSHNKCTPVSNKLYSTYRLQHPLRDVIHKRINKHPTNWKPVPIDYYSHHYNLKYGKYLVLSILTTYGEHETTWRLIN